MKLVEFRYRLFNEEENKQRLRRVQIERLHAAAEQLGVRLHRGVGSEVSSVEDRLSVGQEKEQHGGSGTTERYRYET